MNGLGRDLVFEIQRYRAFLEWCINIHRVQDEFTEQVQCTECICYGTCPLLGCLTVRYNNRLYNWRHLSRTREYVYVFNRFAIAYSKLPKSFQ